MSAPGVLKFGGSSVRTSADYSRLAEALSERIERTGRLVVVVSAQPGQTEQLRERLHEVDPQPHDATAAGLLTLADTVSAHLLCAALHAHNRSAVVLAGHQLGITTTRNPMRARVERLDPAPLRRALEEHEVVVVPGGQAADERGRPTWLGKNSSDLSAILVASALGAPECEIHSDVDGIYSADPNLVTGARMLRDVSYASASTMSLHGAKVLHRRAVQLAEKASIAIVCRHNQPPFRSGTLISAAGAPVQAVIHNPGSVVLAFGNPAEADLAHSVLRAQNVDSARLEDGPHVAVVHCYLDLDHFAALHGLPKSRVVGIPVTELVGSRVITHIAADEQSALELAQRLHDEIVAADPPLASVAHGAARDTRVTLEHHHVPHATHDTWK